jgi:hypothetical protein
VKITRKAVFISFRALKHTKDNAKFNLAKIFHIRAQLCGRQFLQITLSISTVTPMSGTVSFVFCLAVSNLQGEMRLYYHYVH